MKQLSKKWRMLVGVVLLSAMSAATAFAQDTLTLSLEQAIEIALSESPTIRIADREIERVDYSKKSAWYGLLPTLDGTGQYAKYMVPGQMSMMGQVMNSPTDYNASLGLQLALPLVAPSLWKSIQLSELEMQMAVEKSRASKITLRNDVTKAYYSILLAQDSYNVLEEGYKIAKDNYDEAKKRFEVGLSAEYDYISAEVQMTNLMPNLLQVKNGISQAKMYLKVLIGMDVSVPLSVVGNLADFENEVALRSAEPEMGLVNNTDLKQLDIQRSQLDKSFEIQRSLRMPTLAFFSQYGYSGMGNNATTMNLGGMPIEVEKSSAWYSQGMLIGLTLNIPIFHITDIIKEKQIKIQSNQLQIQREYLENSLNFQIRTSIDNMNKTVEQVNAAKIAIAGAQKAYTISTKRYEVGVGTMLELQNAALAVTQSQLSYRQAISDFLTAKADLDKVLGNE
ncbi:MAG: TolC family protein [Tannerella sp.]|nr:TolC family protein [Tannerella sp.]